DAPSLGLVGTSLHRPLEPLQGLRSGQPDVTDGYSLATGVIAHQESIVVGAAIGEVDAKPTGSRHGRGETPVAQTEKMTALVGERVTAVSVGIDARIDARLVEPAGAILPGRAHPRVGLPVSH